MQCIGEYDKPISFVYCSCIPNGYTYLKKIFLWFRDTTALSTIWIERQAMPVVLHTLERAFQILIIRSSLFQLMNTQVMCKTCKFWSSQIIIMMNMRLYILYLYNCIQAEHMFANNVYHWFSFCFIYWEYPFIL